ncbi:MAG: Histidinol-phosphate aminotransferase [Microgenomates group bacterium GW2011_GWA1_48_10]|nr:MAG: Histidinol-phosphate aminotransferase [Microgenomates group bacterium GW2011_GWA1_48_10]OHA94343.1 MAG: hypothetical protein A3B88_04500 [Candidatus Zambryskibacteria bacterium RIFCSPHIGHO2_02_FULL_39_19]
MNTTQIPSFRNLYAFGKKLPIDLSLSENPLGCTPKVSVALRGLTQHDFFDYPDPDCSKLKQVIATRFKLKTESVFVANGSEAIIKLITQIVIQPEDEVIIPELTFPMFDIASKLSGGKVVLSKMTSDFDIDLEDINSKITDRTKLIILCNPNNPTGKVIPKKKILAFVKSTQITIIVDEANIEFGGQTVIKEVESLPNLVVLRTFSKAFGLAGFRVGFCAASPEIIQLLKQTSQPFPVSTVAEKVALIAFEDIKFIAKSKRFMDKERLFLTRELSKRDFKVVNSQANNLLVIVDGSSTDFVTRLNEEGVSVVDGSCFRFNGLNFFRVSPRLRRVNMQLLKAIDNITDDLSSPPSSK